MSSITPPDKARIANCFGRAAAHYDGAATLQREIGRALLQRLQRHNGIPRQGHCVDIGCGTGFMLSQLHHHHALPAARLTGMDLAPPMLAQARQNLPQAHWLCADAEHSGLATGSMQLCISNLAVQWLKGLDAFLTEMYRVLMPGGWLAFTTLGNATLSEFRALCQDAGFGTPINRFMTATTLQDSLAASLFECRQVERKSHAVNYPDALALMRGLKALGAHHLQQAPGPLAPNTEASGAGRTRRGIPPRASLARLTALSSQRFPYGVPARYDCWFVILQKPEAAAV